ncbi:DUF389 domain-containing protein [Streptomyces sp. NP160]|uniref:DUF389 domain-containing protein n=1 Tax=Streptomyces sp. NP160 TaxID=2586637 RepID=UPI0011199225|nr:DUF389 domain-containing protein [Streptomyces sp. NP160]TNM64548.1 DUF389 domain-containing protein [Streptomyces sp. NP160]
MLHLRIVAPPHLSEAVAEVASDATCSNLVVLPGAARRPAGDLLLFDVAREGADAVLQRLRQLGLPRDGSIAVEDVDLSVSQAAEDAERAAPGHGSDALVWEDLAARTREDSTLSASYLVFFAVATALAGLAVLTDSAILVIGAMIVGPEYGALAGLCAAVVLRRTRQVRRCALALLVGFAVGIAATVVTTWVLDAVGLISADMLTRDRPQTGFIYNPDALSFVVAFLAGIAGMLALTSAKSGAVVGVLVSVTTIPAAGNAAVAATYALSAEPASRAVLLEQAWTSVEQLLLNTLGILLAGVLTLWVQHGVWRRVGRASRGQRARVTTRAS